MPQVVIQWIAHNLIQFLHNVSALLELFRVLISIPVQKNIKERRYSVALNVQRSHHALKHHLSRLIIEPLPYFYWDHIALHESWFPIIYSEYPNNCCLIKEMIRFKHKSERDGGRKRFKDLDVEHLLQSLSISLCDVLLELALEEDSGPVVFDAFAFQLT